MPLSTFPIPKKDPKYSFPNRFGVSDEIFTAIVRQCQIQIDASGTGVSGTWTPAITNGSNVSSSSNVSGFYQRIGNIVMFSCVVSITATSSGVSTTFSLALPIASNFGTSADAGGAAVEGFGAGGTLVADAINDLLFIQYLSGSVSARSISINGSYSVI